MKLAVSFLIIIACVAALTWSAFDEIPRLGIGLFLLVFIADIIFSGFVEEWLYRLAIKAIRIFRNK